MKDNKKQEDPKKIEATKADIEFCDKFYSFAKVYVANNGNDEDMVKLLTNKSRVLAILRQNLND